MPVHRPPNINGVTGCLDLLPKLPGSCPQQSSRVQQALGGILADALDDLQNGFNVAHDVWGHINRHNHDAGRQEELPTLLGAQGGHDHAEDTAGRVHQEQGQEEEQAEGDSHGHSKVPGVLQGGKEPVVEEASDHSGEAGALQEQGPQLPAACRDRLGVNAPQICRHPAHPWEQKVFTVGTDTQPVQRTSGGVLAEEIERH